MHCHVRFAFFALFFDIFAKFNQKQRKTNRSDSRWPNERRLTSYVGRDVHNFSNKMDTELLFRIVIVQILKFKISLESSCISTRYPLCFIFYSVMNLNIRVMEAIALCNI